MPAIAFKTCHTFRLDLFQTVLQGHPPSGVLLSSYFQYIWTHTCVGYTEGYTTGTEGYTEIGILFMVSWYRSPDTRLVNVITVTWPLIRQL